MSLSVLTAFTAWAQAPPALTQKLDVSQHGFSVRFPDTWAQAPSTYRNAYELRNVPPGQAQRPAAASAARILITVEQRRSHAEAVRRLSEIAAEYKVAANFIKIGGWPALQREYAAPLARTSVSPGGDPGIGLQMTTAIAAGALLVRLDGTLPPGSARRIIDEALAIGQSIAFASLGPLAAPGQDEHEVLAAREDAAQTERKMKALRGSVAQASAGYSPVSEVDRFLAAESANPQATVGLNTRINGGTGVDSEIEVAVSPDGRHIVIGNNARDYAHSHDGGQTWQLNTIAPGFGANGDPSLAWARGGNFYYAFIGLPLTNPTPGCTTAVTRSTDNGQTFTFVGNAAVCQLASPTCFPDQEHIAADRNNLAPGGNQVYNVWRNFTPSSGTPNCNQIGSGFVTPSITCSQDSGANWTATAAIGAGDFPRVTVGADGFVYAVYWSGGNLMLHKFSSCAGGLAPQVGFPVVAAGGVTGVDCSTAGLPGHDRCDQNPTSNTVAVDDTNPNHIFVAYATNTAVGAANSGFGNEDIVARDSTDGGATWSAGSRVNNPFPGRRFMPWACAVGGSAYIGWYDRREATPANNDLTHYYVGSVSRSGGNLVAGTEYKISEVSDNWCASGWPCSTRSTISAESCSVQPQLAGTCLTNCTTGGGSGVACDFSTGCAAPGETCCTGNGCPKYGDYSGIGCAAGRFYAAWASATSPPSIAPPSNTIDVFVSSKVVCCVPQVQVPGGLSFPETCVGSTSVQTLNVCNTGKTNLEVNSVTSSNPRFVVAAPSSGYPVMISPDFCFPFQVSFTPTTTGSQNATLTIATNDPVNPSVTVQATGSGGQQNIATLIPDLGNFGGVCLGSFKDLPLTISNSGSCTLSVTGVTSTGADSAQFKVASTLTYPLTIAPGGNVVVPIRFEPVGPYGARSATIQITSNDPDEPVKNVPVSGTVPSGDLTLTGSPDFGDVCVGTLAEKTIQVCNTGLCNLNVTSVALNPGCVDFQLIKNPFPNVVSKDSCLGVTIRFTPTSAGLKTCTLTVTTDDPTSGTQQMTLTATTPFASVSVPPNMTYLPEVIQNAGACKTLLPFPITNTGKCNLTVNSLAFGPPVAGEWPDHSLSGLPQPLPTLLAPGNQLGQGDLRTVFAPTAIDRDRVGTLTLTYVSDPVTGATQSVARTACGEGVLTGARVLVKGPGGVPLPLVEKLQIQRITSNRNKNQVDTVDVAQNLSLASHTPAVSCAPFQYHREYGTVSNPVQLLPGSYRVTATAIIAGKRKSLTVAFDLQTCDFNPTVIVQF